MARAVQEREGLEAIPVIAHGRPSEVSFSAGALNTETMVERPQVATPRRLQMAAIRSR